jgi:hypothetical protein
MPPRHAHRWLFGALAALALLGCSGKSGLSVTGLKPDKGPNYGGDPVTISGSGFTEPKQGIKIYFGNKRTKPPVIVSDTEIRVDPPAGAVGETVDVELYFDDARSVRLPKAYTYLDATPPPVP